MLRICHRVNTIKQLTETSLEYGVEMDLHAFGNRLVVHHDPFVDSLDFEEWLEHYNHRFVILNIKEEGIEHRVRELILKKGLSDFFMLDLSFPNLVKMINHNETRVAIRISDYEPIETALAFSGKAQWIWLDLFKKEFPLTPHQYDALKKANYQICLVSPELHGREKSEISSLRSFLEENNLWMDAVCTKYPDLW